MSTMIWVEPVIKPDFTLVCSNSTILHKADIPQDGEGYLFYDGNDTYSVTSATAPGYTSNISVSGTTNLASQIVFTRDNNYVRFGVRPKGITGLKVNDSSAVTYSDSDTTTDYYLVNTLISTNATVSADDYVTENVGNITEGMIIALKPMHLYRYEKTNDPTSAMYTGNTDTIAEAQPLYEEDGSFNNEFIDDINSGNFTIHEYKPWLCWLYSNTNYYTKGKPSVGSTLYDQNLNPLSTTRYEIIAVAEDLSTITIYNDREGTEYTYTRNAINDINKDSYTISYYVWQSENKTIKYFSFDEYFGTVSEADVQRLFSVRPTSTVPVDKSGLETYSFRSFLVNDTNEGSNLSSLIVGMKIKNLSKIEYIYNATLNYPSETTTITVGNYKYDVGPDETYYGMYGNSCGSTTNPLFKDAYWCYNNTRGKVTTTKFRLSNASNWVSRPTTLSWTANINNGEKIYTQDNTRDYIYQNDESYYKTSGTFSLRIDLTQKSNTLKL